MSASAPVRHSKPRAWVIFLLAGVLLFLCCLVGGLLFLRSKYLYDDDAGWVDDGGLGLGGAPSSPDMVFVPTEEPRTQQTAP